MCDDLYSSDSLVEMVEDWSQLPADPLVSVWMITYNHEAYIQKALDSILMQQVNFPYEIVIGEDKSTDSTRDIVCELQRRYPEKIRLRLAKENFFSKGVNPTIGVLQLCRGRYIAMCEGDDFWTDPQKLKKQVDFLEAHPECSLCFHNVFELYPDGSMVPRKAQTNENATMMYCYSDLLKQNFIATCSLVFRAPKCMMSLSMVLTRLRFVDWALSLYLSKYGSIAYIDEIMGVYRLHAGGVCTAVSMGERHANAVRFLSMVLHDHDMNDGQRDREIITAICARAIDTLVYLGEKRNSTEIGILDMITETITACPDAWPIFLSELTKRFAREYSMAVNTIDKYRLSNCYRIGCFICKPWTLFSKRQADIQPKGRRKEFIC